MIETIAAHGYMYSAKAIMSWIGVDCGPARPSAPRSKDSDQNTLRAELEATEASLTGSHEREKRKAELIVTYRDDLLKDTLPFWLPGGCVDKEQGGFMTRDQDGSLLDTDKGMWQQCHGCKWLLATLYNTAEPQEGMALSISYGLEFIDKNGFDEDGRMWFQILKKVHPYVNVVIFLRKPLCYCLCLLCQSNWEIQYG